MKKLDVNEEKVRALLGKIAFRLPIDDFENWLPAAMQESGFSKSEIERLTAIRYYSKYIKCPYCGRRQIHAGMTTEADAEFPYPQLVICGGEGEKGCECTYGVLEHLDDNDQITLEVFPCGRQGEWRSAPPAAS